MTSVPVICSHNFDKIINKRHFVHRFVSWILSEKQEVSHTLLQLFLSSSLLFQIGLFTKLVENQRRSMSSALPPLRLWVTFSTPFWPLIPFNMTEAAQTLGLIQGLAEVVKGQQSAFKEQQMAHMEAIQKTNSQLSSLTETVESLSESQAWIGYAGTHVPMFVHKLGLINPRQT